MTERATAQRVVQRASVEESPLWGVNKTANYLGIPKGTLYPWVSRGEGPRSYRVGKYRKWKPAEVLAWLETRSS